MSSFRGRRADRVHHAVPSSLSTLEADVMGEIWALGEAPVRTVMSALNQRASRPRAYTTYMTILVRLEAKGVVRRRRDGKTDWYSAVFSREEYLALRAESEVDAIVREFGEVALSQFARRIAGLDPERRHALERLASAEPNRDQAS